MKYLGNIMFILVSIVITINYTYNKLHHATNPKPNHPINVVKKYYSELKCIITQ